MWILATLCVERKGSIDFINSLSLSFFNNLLESNSRREINRSLS